MLLLAMDREKYSAVLKEFGLRQADLVEVARTFMMLASQHESGERALRWVLQGQGPENKPAADRLFKKAVGIVKSRGRRPLSVKVYR
jgi:hypothetical protein